MSCPALRTSGVGSFGTVRFDLCVAAGFSQPPIVRARRPSSARQGRSANQPPKGYGGSPDRCEGRKPSKQRRKAYASGLVKN